APHLSSRPGEETSGVCVNSVQGWRRRRSSPKGKTQPADGDGAVRKTHVIASGDDLGAVAAEEPSTMNTRTGRTRGMELKEERGRRERETGSLFAAAASWLLRDLRVFVVIFLAGGCARSHPAVRPAGFSPDGRWRSKETSMVMTARLQPDGSLE